MHRIPALKALPDQIEMLAQELEHERLSKDQKRSVDALRKRAAGIASDVEAHRTIWSISRQHIENDH